MTFFNDFLCKSNSRENATTKIKIYQVLSSIGLDIVGIYIKDGHSESDMGIDSLHPTKKNTLDCRDKRQIFW